MSLLLPPPSEQARIVGKLEELLSDLDAGVGELKAAQKKLAQYRQSLLKAAVEGTLTADWRKHNLPGETGAQLLQRILHERRQRWEAKQLARFEEKGKTPPKGWQDKYPEPVQPDATGLPSLPKSWAWASAEQLCDFITKGTTPPKGLDPFGVKSVPFLRVTNLTDNGTLDFSDKVFVSHQVHEGFLGRSIVYPSDVLMNIVGPPLGQVSMVPSDFAEWNINQAIAIFRALDGIMPVYICSYLLSALAQQWFKKRAKTTAGQTNLTLELCRLLPVPLPPVNEQEKLVSLIEASTAAVDAQATAIMQSLKQAAAQRKNILKAAFSGQLVPQDPADEPASVLLDRIRAERAACTGEGRRRGRRAQVA
jgi:type I restriction enzyme S subunit